MCIGKIIQGLSGEGDLSWYSQGCQKEDPSFEEGSIRDPICMKKKRGDPGGLNGSPFGEVNNGEGINTSLIISSRK